MDEGSGHCSQQDHACPFSRARYTFVGQGPSPVMVAGVQANLKPMCMARRRATFTCTPTFAHADPHPRGLGSPACALSAPSAVYPDRSHAPLYGRTGPVEYDCAFESLRPRTWVGRCAPMPMTTEVYYAHYADHAFECSRMELRSPRWRTSRFYDSLILLSSPPLSRKRFSNSPHLGLS